MGASFNLGEGPRTCFMTWKESKMPLSGHWYTRFAHCAASVIRHAALIVGGCAGPLLGFAACSDEAVSAVPEARPVAIAEAASLPQWLREALNRLPANVRDNFAAIDTLEINRSRGADPWTGDELLLLARFRNLKQLLISGSIAPTALDRLKEAGCIERMTIYSAVTDSDLKALAGLPCLKSIMIRNTRQITQTGTKYLSESKTLEKIEIPYAYNPDVALVRPLGDMKGLKLLRLYTVSPVTEAKVAVIAKLKGPAALDLCLGEFLPGEPPDRLLAPLRGKANIEGFSIHWEWPRKDDKDPALAIIETLTNLKRLDLQNTNVNDADLARLAVLVNLRELNLARTGITDAGLAHLRPLVYIQKLDLHDARLTDASRTVLRNMTEMKELNLFNAGVGDATVGVLGGLQRLESLELGGNAVSATGLAHLAALKNLKYLGLSECGRVNDQALIPVGKITSLEELRLAYLMPHPSVTDKGIRLLAGLKNLRKLNLVNCSVERKAVMDILKEIKGLEVTFTGDKPFQEYETLIVGAEDRRP